MARRYVPADIDGLGFDPDLADMLRDEPVARVRMAYGEGEAWLVTRYEDVKFVTSDPRFSRAAVLGTATPRMTKHRIPTDRAVSFTDPPEHARLRRVVAKAFAQRNVEQARERAERALHSLLDAMVDAGPPADLIAHVTSPFPMAVVGELLGVPPADQPWLIECASIILSQAQDQAAVDRTHRIKAEVAEYFLAHAAQRGAEPRDDLLTALAEARDRGELDDEELTALTQLLAMNGWHGPRNNCSNMVYLLLTRPVLRARLRSEPGAIPRAVEELLRYIPHKNGVGIPRVATEDVEIRGVLIRAGDVVYNSYVAANWDPDVFPEPDMIDIDRPDIPHLAFGHGPHYCLAPLLARMEANVLLSTLLTRLPDLRLAVPPEEVRWPAGALIRGPIDLPVAW